MGGYDVIAHQGFLVCRQTIDDQMHRLFPMTDHSLEQVDKQFTTERSLVRLEPKATARVDCRGCGDRLTLPGAMDHRSLSTHAPRLAMYRVGTKTRFVPKEYLSSLTLRLRGNGRKTLALPPLYRLRVTLVGALQRLLRCEPQFSQQRPHGGDAHTHAEFLLDQDGDDLPRPQSEVQTVLQWIAAVDPAKYLAFLLRRKPARTSGATCGAQCLQSVAASRCRLHPFVDRRSAKAERRNDLDRFLAFTNALNRH